MWLTAPIRYISPDMNFSDVFQSHDEGSATLPAESQSLHVRFAISLSAKEAKQDSDPADHFASARHLLGGLLIRQNVLNLLHLGREQQGRIMWAAYTALVQITQTQQLQKAFNDIAVANPNANVNLRFNQGVEIDLREMLAGTRQISVGNKVVRQSFYNNVGHTRSLLKSGLHTEIKSFISNDKVLNADIVVTD